MPTESTLQAWVMKYARSRGILPFKWSSPSTRGVPDLILILPTGRTIYLEMKSPKGTGKLSRLQEITIRQIRNQGADVYVCDSKEAAFNAIEEGLANGEPERRHSVCV